MLPTLAHTPVTGANFACLKRVEPCIDAIKARLIEPATRTCSGFLFSRVFFFRKTGNHFFATPQLERA